MGAEVVELPRKGPEIQEHDAWLRRQAIQIAAQLPSDVQEARKVIALVVLLLDTFLTRLPPP